jgi:hypothetical protein
MEANVTVACPLRFAKRASSAQRPGIRPCTPYPIRVWDTPRASGASRDNNRPRGVEPLSPTAMCAGPTNRPLESDQLGPLDRRAVVHPAARHLDATACAAEPEPITTRSNASVTRAQAGQKGLGRASTGPSSYRRPDLSGPVIRARPRGPLRGTMRAPASQQSVD